MAHTKSAAQCASAVSLGSIGDAATRNSMQLSALRMDADNTIFLERELLGMVERIFETVRPPRNAERWIPSSSALPEFVRQTSYRQMDGTVKFEPYEGAGHDVPRASKKLAEIKHDVIGYHAGCFWTFDEIGAAQMVGFNLSQQGLADLMTAFETLRNFLAWYGDATRDLSGFLSLPNTQSSQLLDSTGAALQITDAADPDELIGRICDMIDDVPNETSDSFFANTCLISSPQFRILECLRVTGRDRTVLEQLRIVRPDVTFAPVREFSGVDALSTQLTAGGAANIVTPAGAPTTNYMAAYNMSAEVLEQQVPMPLRMDPDLYQSGPSEWGLIGRGRIGSVHNPYPGAIQIRYGI